MEEIAVPWISKCLFGVVAISPFTLLALHGSPFLPFEFTESVLDVLLGAAMLSVLAMGSVFTLDFNNAYFVACGCTVSLLFVNGVKAAVFDWMVLSQRDVLIAALTLSLPPACFLGAAFEMHRSAHKAEGGGDNDKYKALADSKEAVLGEEEPPELSVLKVVVTLKAYFWPRQTLGRVNVILTWLFVGGSNAASIAAPLFISKAINNLAEGEIKECANNAVYYGTLLFVSTLLKQLQGLVYLGVKQAAFTDLAEDTFGHVHKLSLQWHLKKKLGEVIRVMDRGITACDTLMQYGEWTSRC